MIFAKRYAELIYVGNDSLIHDDICGDWKLQLKEKLIELMTNFNQPLEFHNNRYDSDDIKKTDAFSYACEQFNDIMDIPYLRNDYTITYEKCLLAQPVAHIFSVIELQYDCLYSYQELDGLFSQEYIDEKAEFSRALNEFFLDKDIPWRILDGKMIKIDAKQFECDLRAKSLAAMKELKDTEPKFQSAFTELTDAIEYLDKGDYQSAINNAGKSYESILKVILGVDNGNAYELTRKYKDTFLRIPSTMPTGGFESQVMKALPFIRNNSGADHGAGAKAVVISKPMANLAVNLAAALDTYLIEEYAERTATVE